MSCTRIDGGPLAVGARRHNVSKEMGTETDLTYELTRSRTGRLIFVGIDDTATSTGDITITPAQVPGSTTITAEAGGSPRRGTARSAFATSGNDDPD